MLKLTILLLLLGVVNSQENAGSSVAPGLIKCYNTTALRDRDSRLPSTMNVLIDLIRRIEDGKSKQDARVISTQLIHRFRQDGIVKTNSQNPLIFPYTPKGDQHFKNEILLKEYIPGTAVNFPNETLNDVEICSMHYMLSNTFELRKRGDENNVCNKLGRYTMRIKRQSRETEGLEETNPKKNPSKDVISIKPRTYVIDSNDISDCPIESGVVYTRWGAVQAGSVLAAIAAGFEPQDVLFEDIKSKNNFAVTISGDLAEVAFLQGSSENTYDIGTKGSWNSTLVPKYYFIQRKDKYQMTDAEVRGDLDGLILSENIENWRRKYTNIKISQILDMYYSQRGVFTKDIRACRRKELSTEYAPEEKLREQAVAFGYHYNNIAIFDGTITRENVPTLIEKTIKQYLNYYPQLNDLSCDADDELERIATDIIIVLDADWRYDQVYPAISHLLDNLDINRYQSNYTIINANDGSIIVNSSNSILNYHEVYNSSTHDDITSRGFSIRNSMPMVENLLKEQIEMDKANSVAGGKSTIVLFVPYSQSIPSDEASFFQERRSRILNDYMPDVRFLVLGAGNKQAYSSLVQSNDDVFTLSPTDDSSVITTIKPLIKRIAEVPRKIKNPRCNSYMSGDQSQNTITLYVEPSTINYYKVSPNYLFGEGPKSLKVRAQWGTLSFCYSRSESRPRDNSTSSGTCKKISSGEETIDLTDTCVDSLSECSPLYFSIEAPPSTGSNLRCTDSACRFPDNIEFKVTIDGFGCTSDSTKLISSFLLISIMLYILNF